MAYYVNGTLISGANTLPKMTMAEYLALPVSERPTYWECTDKDYEDISAENVSYGSGTVKSALDRLVTDFALGNDTVLWIPLKNTATYSFMYLHMYGIYAGANTAFQSAISARKPNAYSWICSSTDTNISVEVVGDNLKITFPNAYAAGTYSVKYSQ